MKTKFSLIAALFLVTLCATAQFSLDGELRPRTEYRNGFNNLIKDASEPGFGTSTRARLNFGYKSEGYETYVSLQDVFVWGENRQILPTDANDSFSIFEAWANIKLTESTGLKLGRQSIAYDDQRIMGGLDWAQQGRNHDAFLHKYWCLCR